MKDREILSKNDATASNHSLSLFSKEFLIKAILQAFKKFNPVELFHNPVIFITEIGAIATLLEWIFFGTESNAFYAWIFIWLFLTVLFANFAESIAEIRNQAQAESLRRGRIETIAHLKQTDGSLKKIPASSLKKGDIVAVGIDEIIPGDGEVIEGITFVDESAITGESTPVVRAAGEDNCSVTSGTRVVSDPIIVKIGSNPGHSFLDRMIDLIESAKKKKSNNEVALTILLAGLTFIFLVVVVAMKIFGNYFDANFSPTRLIALLICLIPTTIGGLLSAIGIAGINRLMKQRVLAMSGQAVEIAGDVNLILIDKTGTITGGKRHATEMTVASHVPTEELVRAAYLTSVHDQTHEGKSIIEFLKIHHAMHLPKTIPSDLHFIPFSASTRMSGVDFKHEKFRKGAMDAIEKLTGAPLPNEISHAATRYAEQGGTPLIVSNQTRVLGVILLKDIIKKGLTQLFNQFRDMGIHAIMLTGDNPITASSIAKEVGIDEFIAEVSPEEKLNIVQNKQKEGWIVAMTGDGVNDAPALAHADVGVAMNSGSQAAKEAGNMIDLDSHPDKLFEIIEIGKQMLMTRGALTTFSIANDVAKYFIIIPAILIPFFPAIKALDLMHFTSTGSAIVSAIIFNALVIPALIPLAFKGVKIITKSAKTILRRNLIIYGLGGILVPFIFIKLIDMILHFLEIGLL